MNRSMNAVEASGMMSMSLSLIAFHPRMLEPSNPKPSSNDDSSSLSTGTEKCCHCPGKSMNLKSIIVTASSLISLKTRVRCDPELFAIARPFVMV